MEHIVNKHLQFPSSTKKNNFRKNNQGRLILQELRNK